MAADEMLHPGQFGLRESWHPGERACFEYHCLESNESQDAATWHRSHNPVTVVGRHPGDAWEGSTLAERSEEGVPHAYEVRHDSGYQHTAMEDELFTSPHHYVRPDPPGHVRTTT